MGIRTLGGGDIFQVVLENSLYKKSEYESQTKKIIPFVNSTVCHFSFPTSQVYGSPYLYPCFSWYIFPTNGIYSPYTLPQISWGSSV